MGKICMVVGGLLLALSSYLVEPAKPVKTAAATGSPAPQVQARQ